MSQQECSQPAKKLLAVARGGGWRVDSGGKEGGRGRKGERERGRKRDRERGDLAK